MKHEWRRKEKQYYLPKREPQHLYVPKFQFFTIHGTGNPNSAFFAEHVQVLYSVSYAIRMSHKKGMAPKGYFEYTVYPLEGVWDLTEKGRANYQGILDKDELVFTLMIRQPDFVKVDFAIEMIRETQKKKPHRLLEQVKFESIEEGDCIQMLHLGSYDNEPASFEQMEEYAERQKFKRRSKLHREIYLTDPRKTNPEKLKTVLRFQVDHK